MSENTTEAILKNALALSTRDRVRLARKLLASIEEDAEPGEPAAEWEEAWRVEIERRIAEVRDGTVETEDPTLVIRELRAELAARRTARPKRARVPTTKTRRRAK